MPGHYVAGSDWRPRHLHMKVTSPGLNDVVTQIYFDGDPFLGVYDTACSSCKSDHLDLIVDLKLGKDDGDESIDFNMMDLESIGVREEDQIDDDGGSSAPTSPSFAPSAIPTDSPSGEGDTKNPTPSSSNPSASPSAYIETEAPVAKDFDIGSSSHNSQLLNIKMLGVLVLVVVLLI